MEDIVSLLASPSGIGGLSVGTVVLIFIVYMYLLERKKENQKRNCIADSLAILNFERKKINIFNLS